jgi:threonine aldolase
MLKNENKNLIDLRSDTVTKPCDKMRNVIANTVVGDCYYKEDEVTNELERYCASYFGTEDALFMITGTMANQVAIRCSTSPGDDLVGDSFSHIVYYCAGAVADLGKVSLKLINATNGIITLEDILQSESFRFRSDLTSNTKLIWLENSIGHYGGRIYPIEELKKIYGFSKKNDIKIHLDGARLLNACIASKVSPKEYIKYTDSAMFSFSKALGAPAGSILLGSKAFIKKARLYQKWYGGGLHQSGVLASACLFAIKNNLHYIEKDHNNAKLLAKLSLKNLEESQNIVNLDLIETNIVMFDVKHLNIPIDKFIEIAKSDKVLLYRWSDNIIRAVTHKDIQEEEIVRAASIINNIFKLCL